MEGRKGLIGVSTLIACVVVGAVLILMCTERIPTGYVGVVYSMNGGVNGETLAQGWHVVSPTKKVTTYSIGLEQSYLTSGKDGDSQEDESFNVPTADGKTVRVNLEFSYRFDPERVTDVFSRFKGQNGKTVKDTFIKPKIKAWTQEVTAHYPVTDIFGDKRTAINAELDTYLREKFDGYGIIIDTVNFTDISVDTETAAAIQKKVTAQQEFELANIESQTAQVQANKDKEVATIAAETARIQAQGEADVKKIEADAEAEANHKIAASLTPELVEYMYAQTWNGELPKITGGGSTIVNASDYFKAD